MKIFRLITLTIACLAFSIIAHSQETEEIQNKVIAFGFIPLNKVEVRASKSGVTTYTDSLGRFTIQCTSKDQLIISAAGFDRMKIKVKNFDNKPVDLIYSNRNTSLEEAVGNGHIPRNIIEDAIVKYPLKGEIDYSRYTNIFDLIDDRIFNVNVSGDYVTTNKPNSFTHSQEVLYVVDGTTVSDITFVTPNNVKTIKYVDGTEAAKYGSRGANGVIEITLKR